MTGGHGGTAVTAKEVVDEAFLCQTSPLCPWLEDTEQTLMVGLLMTIPGGFLLLKR
jgi:hypothetical protein